MEQVARKTNSIYAAMLKAIVKGERLFAILIDPEDFNIENAKAIIQRLPDYTTHILVGGSTATHDQTEQSIIEIKKHTVLPVIIFPGDYSQITNNADGILFLSLLSGRNPEYLIEQQIKSVEQLRFSDLEIIPTAYILIDGGKITTVQQVSATIPIARDNVDVIVKTALAGQFSGKKAIYLEAGSGALFPVPFQVIEAVKEAVTIPVIIGGGIRTEKQMQSAYLAGADMIVIGTAFEIITKSKN